MAERVDAHWNDWRGLTQEMEECHQVVAVDAAERLMPGIARTETASAMVSEAAAMRRTPQSDSPCFGIGSPG